MIENNASSQQKFLAPFISDLATQLHRAEQNMTTGNPENAEAVMNACTEQLHCLAKIEAYTDTKMLHIVHALNDLQGKLTAKEVNLQTTYKALKIEERITSDAEQHKKIEAEMKIIGAQIRELDSCIATLKETKDRVVQDTKREISSLRLIGHEATTKTEQKR